LFPITGAEDIGFDRLAILVPSEVEGVLVQVGGGPVEVTYAQRGDTLGVELPKEVRSFGGGRNSWKKVLTKLFLYSILPPEMMFVFAGIFRRRLPRLCQLVLRAFPFPRLRLQHHSECGSDGAIETFRKELKEIAERERALEEKLSSRGDIVRVVPPAIIHSTKGEKNHVEFRERSQ